MSRDSSGTYTLVTKREEKFWSQVEIPRDVVTGCWMWTGCRNESGYGVMKLGGRASRIDRAHRISWSLVNGPVPNGAHILHSCDVPACVNPAHLRPGSDKENAEDRVLRNRGRGGSSPGEKHHAAKLTEVDIAEIRTQYVPAGGKGKRPSGPSTNDLALRYGVTQTTIWRVVNGHGWRHV